MDSAGAFMTIKRKYRFRPGWLMTLLSLIVACVLIKLGFWQLSRAAEKQQIEQALQQRQQQLPIEVQALLATKSFESLVYRQAKLNGYYDNEQQFLYDNKTHQGKAGFHVLTPFRLNETHAILVNRGWIPYQDYRDQIPNIQISTSSITVLGQLKQPSQALQLQVDQFGNKQYPKIIQNIDYKKLSSDLGLSLLPSILELDSEDSFGFVREWQAYYGQIERHHAYAVQWFLMAAIVVGLFVFLNLKRIDIELSEK